MKTTLLYFNTITILSLYSLSIAIAAPGKPYSDEWYAGRIHGALAYNSYLDSSDLVVEMKQGTATLTGTVTSDTERELAEQITSSINGVTSINNKIDVNPNQALKTRPDWFQKFTDFTTTAAIKSRLLVTKDVSGMDIGVGTRDGIVVLSGSVGTLAQKETANAIAESTRDVLGVQNDLKIVDPKTLAEKAENITTKLSRDVSDTWISSKIRTSLLFSSDFPGSNVKVHTEKGKVILNGYARDQQQSQSIARAVNDFVGVREVDNKLKVKENN